MVRPFSISFIFILFYSYCQAQTIDSNIVLVNLGNLNRRDIAKQLQNLQKHHPKVIGIYATFSKDSAQLDTALVNNINPFHNVVMLKRITNPDNSESPLVNTHHKFRPVASGYSGLIMTVKDSTIQHLQPFITINGFTHISFAIQLSLIYNPTKTAEYLNQFSQQTLLPIKFVPPNKTFLQLSEKDVLDEQFEPALIKDKIVLIGYLGKGDEDSQKIPRIRAMKSNKMHGIEIQACLIHSILK